MGIAEKLITLLPISRPAEKPEEEKRPLSDLLQWERLLTDEA